MPWRAVDGKVAVGDKVSSFATGQSSDVLELGLMTPEPLRVKELRAGKGGEGGRCSSKCFVKGREGGRNERLVPIAGGVTQNITTCTFFRLLTATRA